MNRFIEIAGVVAHILWLRLSVLGVSIINLPLKIMSKTEKPNYISSEIKKVSQVDLKKALIEVNQKNKEVRDSFKMDRETLAFKTGR